MSVSSICGGGPLDYIIGNKKLDIIHLNEWRGMKFDEVGTADWFRNKELPAVDVEQLLNSSIDFENSQFLGEPPIKFSFKSAVQFVLYVIDRNKKLAKGEECLPVFCPQMGGDLLISLTNIDFRGDDLPEPPFYGGKVSSASKQDLSSWLGAILQLLYEKEYIGGYGRNHTKYWFTA
jgi:hypothetical protein